MTRIVWALLLAVCTGLADAAERVVVLAPHLAELACAAGACDRLVGAVTYTDYPPQAAKLPRVGDAFAVNAEALLALHPDLVLAWTGGTPQETLERLSGLGLRVEPVAIRGLADVAAAIERVGDLLGTPVAARVAAAAYRQRLAALRERYRGARPLRVMYQIEADPAFSVNRLSPISEAISLCGGVNVFADMPQIAAPLSKEAVLAAAPEVVVYGEEDRADDIRRYWQAFPQADVVRRQRLYAVDASLLARPSPRVLDGVEQLCGVLARARASG